MTGEKMKPKTKIIALFALLSLAPAFANDAYVRIAGGSVAPFGGEKHADISMHAEEIQIHLFGDYYEVRVDFDFYNKGETQVVAVGFPQWQSGTDEKCEFAEMEVFLNGKKTTFEVREAQSQGELPPYFRILKWFVREVNFPARSHTKTAVRYKCKYGSEGAGFWTADYLFGTGSSWNGSIGSITLKVFNHDPAETWITGVYRPETDEYERISVQNENDVLCLTLNDVAPLIADRFVIITTFASVIALKNPLRVLNMETNWLLSEYVFGDDELRPLTAWQLRILRNLIFARHGHIFASDDINRFLKNYYTATEDYQKGYVPARKVTESDLTETETKNLRAIQAEERRRKK